MDDKEFLKDLDVDLEEQEDKRKRWPWLIVGALLLVLMTSYFIFAPIDYVVRGRIESSSLDQNVLVVGEYTLVFLNDTQSVLEDLYKQYQRDALLETSVCLLGRADTTTYRITDIFYPQIHSQSFTHVSFSACPPQTLVMMHTHPYSHCLASKTDLDTFEKKKKKSNSQLLMLIMCEESRFSLYG